MKGASPRFQLQDRPGRVCSGFKTTDFVPDVNSSFFITRFETVNPDTKHVHHLLLFTCDSIEDEETWDCPEACKSENTVSIIQSVKYCPIFNNCQKCQNQHSDTFID